MHVTIVPCLVLLLALAVKCTIGSDLVRNHSCWGTGAELILSSTSAFANATFNNHSCPQCIVGIGHYVNSSFTSCSRVILNGELNKHLNFSYIDCDAEIYDNSTTGSTYTIAKLNLTARSFGPTQFNIPFELICHYDTETNVSTSHIISGGGGGGGSGNSSGQTVMPAKVDIGIFTLGGIETDHATLGEYLLLVLNLSNTTIYSSMLPEKCFFSTQNTLSEVDAIAFIDASCPHDSGQGIVSSWEYNTNGTGYYVKWRAFQYRRGRSTSQLYIHCLLRECAVIPADCKVPKCSIPWIANNSYGSLIQSFGRSGANSLSKLRPDIYASAGKVHVGTDIITNEPQSNLTIWYVIAGIVGFLLIVSIVVIILLVRTNCCRRTERVEDSGEEQQTIQQIEPLRIPRPKLDYAGLTSYNRNSSAYPYDPYLKR